MTSFLKSSIGRLRIIAFIEGCSFILLVFVGMPLKYFFDSGTLNKIVGQSHGFLFLLFIVATFLAASAHKWKKSTTFWILLSSIIPFGTFIADYKLMKPVHDKDRADSKA
jgi:integral membrane protein